ncbi:MAG: glycosyltransferase family 2 protein [Fulvimonas sp.]|nr:glycosyltransferase family 2 protein [Fulvimonas sp.]
MTVPRLTLVIPCYNEEQALPITMRRVDELLTGLIADGRIAPESRAVYVDDGSRDRTWTLIEQAAGGRIGGIKLAGNRGHQHALLAGLLNVEGDVIVSMDADLQDDLGAVALMLEHYRQGAQIVYGVRSTRRADSAFKRITAEGYYRVLKWLGVDIVFNHADYRLMSRAAIEALRGYGEVNLFLRGIIPQLGFKTAQVEYERAERVAGESKYPLGKMLALAWQGLTSFSPMPLRWITIFGSIVSVLSFLIGLWALVVRLSGNGHAIPGWASTVIPMYFLGGIQLLSLGIIGEYIAKIYLETKRRPRFIIEKQL